MTQLEDLEGLRIAAGLSQEDMANHLGVSQSQISRFEADPDSIPLGIYRAWIKICGEVSSTRPLTLGDHADHDPLSGIKQHAELLTNYFTNAAPVVPNDDAGLFNVPFDKDELIATARRCARKPVLGVAGRSDAGKTRAINTMTGSNWLPASHQPTTNLICLIRHAGDKPSWLNESIQIFGTGFDIGSPGDKANCTDNEIMRGSLSTLKDYGSHQAPLKDAPEFAGATYAVIYLESEFLRGCDIIDVPGYEHSDDDSDRADLATRMVDILVYISPVVGFMNQTDIAYLSHLIRLIPDFESAENGLPALRNLYIVASRADIADSPPSEILDMAASRVYDQLEAPLTQRAKFLTGVPADSAAIRARCFTYSVESPALRDAFETDLVALLTQVAPAWRKGQLEYAMRSAKETGIEGTEQEIATLREHIDNQDAAKSQVQHILDNEPHRLSEKRASESKVHYEIDRLQAETHRAAEHKYNQIVNPSYIRGLIEGRYGKDKKRAKSQAPGHVVEALRVAIDQTASDKSAELTPSIERYLNTYETPFNSSEFSGSSWHFNAKGAFVLSLTACGTWGALAAWASVVAAGSNLGGYILIAKVVSALAAVGIDLGGTAVVMSTVSLLGGPITIAIGISVAAAVIMSRLLSDSWETTLAKKISKEIRSKGPFNRIADQLAQHWDDTRAAFDQAAEGTEAEYQKKLDDLNRMAFSTDADQLKHRVKYIQELRDFFGGIPWRSMG